LVAGAALIGSAHAATTVTISGTPATTATTGSKYSFTPTAKDSDGSTPAFSITGKPAWATFSTTTGQLSGTPTTAGKYINIGIAAYHGTSASSVLWFGITVTGSSQPPSSTPPPSSGPLTISGTPPTTATVGSTYSFAPTATDSAGLKPIFSITGKPSWASFSTSTGLLTGKPTAAGKYVNIGIAAYDGKNSSRVLWFGITVSSSGGTTTPTITLTGTPSVTAVTGKPYSFQPTAKDSSGKAMSFSVQNKPSWASFSISSGLLSGTPPSPQTDSNILISASDGSTSASMKAFTVTVSNAPSGGSSGAATVSWTLPTLNTNGTALTNLAGVRIFYGTSSSTLTQQIQLPGTSTTTYTIDNLAAGTWYFGAAAYNTAGMQSAMSAIVAKSVQ
jgi:hypothetical protein